MNFSNRISAKKLLTILGVFILSGAALSDAHADNINHRQARQDMQIYQGIRNGTLTPSEAAYLERHDDRINRMESRFKTDGHLSHREKRKIHRALNQQNRRIFRQKRDPQSLAGYRFW